MVVVDGIKYILDSMRNVIEVAQGEELPCGYAFCDCEATSGQAYELEPYYFFGTKNEVLQRLSDKDKRLHQKDKIKYPAVILEHNHRESVLSTGTTEMASIKILFANERNPEWSFIESYENNIKPILLPLVKRFKKQVNINNIVGAYEFEPIQINPNLGENAVYASDYWDVVILDMEVLFINNCKTLKLCITN